MRYITILSLFLLIAFNCLSQDYTLQTVFTIDKPETAGLSSDSLQAIDRIADSAIRAHAFPGCQVLVARNGKIVYYKTSGYLNYDSLEPVKPSTIYDLA